MNKRFDAYLSGVTCTLAIESLRQDLFGMERYIQQVRAGWIGGEYTIPLAIFMLVCSGLLYRRAKKP